jgi:predicted DNA-binding WGR domain protein
MMEIHLEEHGSDTNMAHYFRMSVLSNLSGVTMLQREWRRIGQGPNLYFQTEHQP